MTLPKIIIGFGFSIIAVLILILIDGFAFNYKHLNSLLLKPDCNYVMPNGYDVAYSKERGKYAIVWHRPYRDEYLTGSAVLPSFKSMSIYEPDLFDDSCLAKALLKRYFNQFEPTIKDLK